MTRRKVVPSKPLPLRAATQGDGRSREVRTYRAMRRQLIADAGGPEAVTATRLAVIDTLAAGIAITRAEFARYTAKPGYDVARFAALGNLILGAARTLGMKRVPKDVPTLREYLNQPDRPGAA